MAHKSRPQNNQFVPVYRVERVKPARFKVIGIHFRGRSYQLENIGLPFKKGRAHKGKNFLPLNQGPAEPEYVLPLQTV